MSYVYNDGGRERAGYKGKAGDCGVRALAIALQLPYKEVYDKVNEFCAQEKPSKRRRGKSSARSVAYTLTPFIRLDT